MHICLERVPCIQAAIFFGTTATHSLHSSFVMFKKLSTGISRRLSLSIRTLLLCLLLAHVIDLNVASDLDEVLQLKSNEGNLKFLQTDSFSSRDLLDHEREDDHKEDAESDESKQHNGDGMKKSQLREVGLIRFLL